MLKRILLIMIICLVLSSLFILFIFLTDDGYFIGRDTVKSFGNGRFQLVRMPPNDDKYEEIILWDFEHQKEIINDVYSYKEVNNLVYIIGKEIYCILNYKIEEYQCSPDIDDFLLEEQINF